MKAFKYIALASVAALGLTSCGDFGDTNIDPEHLNEANVPYEMLFTNAQHQALGSDWDMWRTGCIYSAQWTQQLSSIGWWWPYGMYYWQDGYNGSYWDTYSSDRGSVRDVTTVYDKWAEDPNHAIDYQLARITRVMALTKMSDLYGDVPYSQAGRPALYAYPKYDAQKDIYMSALEELQDAQAKLTKDAEMGNHDVYFQGKAAQWKKFANSLMLRLAMRMVKVDENAAKKWAAQALANGVMTSVDDDCLLQHPGAATTNDSSEPFAKIHAHEDREFYISNFLVDMLKATGDRRLCLIATIAPFSGNMEQTGDIQANSNGLWSEADYGDMSFEAQRGLPVGGYKSDASATDKSVPYYVGLDYPYFDEPSAYKNEKGETLKVIDVYSAYHSSPNRCTYNDPTAPTFIVTYAQTCFLLAEAAHRGYISGDAKTYYEAGVKAAFNQFKHFPNVAAAQKVAYGDKTADAVAAEYLAANPFNEAKALEMINTQYYINTFGDPHEVFANWRRSGYPVLTPAKLAPLYSQSSTNGQIPRRFSYPQSESQVNKANYDEAVARQGADVYMTRMWWDK